MKKKRTPMVERRMAYIAGVAVLVIVAAAIYLHTFTGATNLPSNVTAKPADKFVDSIGIDTHINRASYNSRYDTATAKTLNNVYDSIIYPGLHDLGVRHIREGFANLSLSEPGSVLDDINRLYTLAHPTDGTQPITPIMGAATDGGSSDPTNSCFATKLKVYLNGGYITCAGDSQVRATNFIGKIPIEGLEADNEPDWCPSTATLCQQTASTDWYTQSQAYNPNWPATTLTHMANIKKVIASDSAFASLKAIAPSYTHMRTIDSPSYQNIVYSSTPYFTLYNYVHQIVNNVDIGNDHPYSSTSQFYDYGTDEAPYVSFYNGKPIYNTEFGYHTDSTGKTATVQAKLTLRGLFDYFDKGIARSYIYELYDEGISSSSKELNFGLIKNDGTRKVAYTALQNTIALLSDPGNSFTPGTLNYALNPSSTTVNQTLLEKRDGSFYLVLRNEIKNSTDTDQLVPTTLTFGQSISKVELYSPQVSVNVQMSYNNPTSISLSVPDKVIILKITPGSSSPTLSPSSSPTPTSTSTPTPTASSQPTLQPSSPTTTATTMHVFSITGSSNKTSSGWKPSATVVVEDNNGNPVKGALVTGVFTASGNTQSISSSTTSNGSVSFQLGSNLSTSVKSVTFQVTDITSSSLSYSSSSNKITSITINQ